MMIISGDFVIILQFKIVFAVRMHVFWGFSPFASRPTDTMISYSEQGSEIRSPSLFLNAVS